MLVMTPWRPWPPDEVEARYYDWQEELHRIEDDYLRDPVLAALEQTATRLVEDDTGDPHPRIVFIGEAPGEEEDRTGVPFVGKSGKCLDEELRPLHIDRSKHYTSNVLKHRPPGNRTPTAAEITAAAPFLRREIDLLDPLIVVTMGNVPTQALWPEAPGITRCHGIARSLSDGRVHLPVVHPSYALRSAEGMAAFRVDLAVLAELLSATRRVLVTGSREWPSPTSVVTALEDELVANGPFTLVHGACPQGADAFADEWAVRRPGLVRIERHPADWGGPCRDDRCTPDHRRTSFGREFCAYTGPARNQEMVDLGASVCHVFRWNGSTGTKDCMDRAEVAGIKVVPHELIHGFFGEYCYLSNFWPASVQLDGETYPTVEHAYQAAKTDNPGARRQVRMADTPGAAKGVGRKLALRPGWEDLRDEVMLALVWAKFSAHPDLAERLLATGDAWLEEANTWSDRYWGTVNGDGINTLGLILMAVREELRARQRRAVA
jgi:uracil-DNA glycosylase family 4